MRNLLRTHFLRLRKDKAFWFCTTAMLMVSVISMLNGCRQALEDPYITNCTIEDYYFRMVPIIGLLAAVFTSLFLGTEYSDGTIRNKIIAGHSRTNVYCANLVVSLFAGFVLVAVCLAGGLTGLPMLGGSGVNSQRFILCTMMTMLLTAALVSVFTLLGSLSANKALTAVITLLIFLGLLLAASLLYNRLLEPEMASNVVMTQNGLDMGAPIPNPKYVDGTRRIVYEWIMDILPTGQSIRLASGSVAHPMRAMVSSVVITLVMSICGAVLFNKKDLK